METLIRYLEANSVNNHNSNNINDIDESIYTFNNHTYTDYLTALDNNNNTINNNNNTNNNNSNNNKNSIKIVKEWGLSHSTLEDVFLDVTKRENFTYHVVVWLLLVVGCF